MHRPWDDLEAFYLDLLDHPNTATEAIAALADLCRRIRHSHLATGLFGHTSLATLGIAQSATDYPPATGHQVLRLSPERDHIIFELAETTPWTRRVPASELPAAFDRVLRQLSWNYHPISGEPPS